MIPTSNASRFGNEYCWQLPGTAMRTPVAANYANLLMDSFDQNLLRGNFQGIGSSYLVWFRFILASNEVLFLSVAVFET